MLAAVAAAGLALGQLRAYIREQEERARPYLVVDFHFRSVLLYVTLENLSATPATDVRLLASPMFQSTMGDRAIDFQRVFGGESTIAQLAPGRTMRWLIDRTPDLFGRTDLPHRFEVTVQYSDPRSRYARNYTDTFVLNLDDFGQASGESDHDNKMWNIADRNERRFEAMKRSLAALDDTLKASILVDSSAEKLARRRGLSVTQRRGWSSRRR